MSQSEDQPEPQAASQRRLKDIVLSTLIVGGGSVVTVVCGVVRGKVISAILGPAGIGLQGVLQSALKTVVSIAAMGLPTSGVREVARLRGSEDTVELGHTLRALRSTTLLLGAIAALVLVALHRQLGSALLGDANLGWTLAILGLGVLAQTLYGAYDAFLRGFRRVALITKASIVANIAATALGVGLVATLGEAGIVWALVAQPIVVLVVAAIAGRDFSLHLVPPDRDRVRTAAGRLLKHGAVLATTAFVTTGVQLFARVVVAHWSSLEDVGYFQAAWAVSALYLGFVLSAMSLDYYPRLAEQPDRTALRQMVNEQARVSFLLAGPAVLGLLTLSAHVVAVLYTDEFGPTVEILRWQLLGDVLKIGSWTLGYVVLAQGRPRAFFMVEMSWNVTYLATLVALLPVMGIMATAVAYIIACGVYFIVLCVVTKRLADFSWTAGNAAFMACMAALAGVVLAMLILLPAAWGVAGGLVVTGAFGAYCLWRLLHEAGFARLTRRFKK